ncbi:MAG: VanZ family protein [Proteobacteria bacterium]|nr:VanZ family protein [Pseudomonadota bacterium]
MNISAKKILRVLGILFVIFLAYVIYSADKGLLPLFIRKIYMFPGGDKAGHIVLLGLLAFFVNYFLYPRCLRVFGKTILIGSLIVFCLITIEEVSQIFISNRTFDLLDLFCSYIGIIAGDLTVKYIKRERGLL